jgi:hypothetical protein
MVRRSLYIELQRLVCLPLQPVAQRLPVCSPRSVVALVASKQATLLRAPRRQVLVLPTPRGPNGVGGPLRKTPAIGLALGPLDVNYVEFGDRIPSRSVLAASGVGPLILLR